MSGKTKDKIIIIVRAEWWENSRFRPSRDDEASGKGGETKEECGNENERKRHREGRGRGDRRQGRRTTRDANRDGVNEECALFMSCTLSLLGSSESLDDMMRQILWEERCKRREERDHFR